MFSEVLIVICIVSKVDKIVVEIYEYLLYSICKFSIVMVDVDNVLVLVELIKGFGFEMVINFVLLY